MEEYDVQKNVIKGILTLFSITFIWGTTFPIIKVIMYHLSPYAYTGLRSLFSLLISIGLFSYLKVSKKKISGKSVYWGFLAGIVYSLAIFFQGWGTGLTTAINSAFLTATYVVMVIVAESLITRHFDIKILILGLSSLFGIFLLTNSRGDLSIGDLLVLISAVAWAAQILLISYAEFDEYFQFVGVMCSVPAFFIIFDLNAIDIREIGFDIWIWLFYLGVVASFFVSYGQVYGQKIVTASFSAVIYQMEPVFAYILSYLFLGESYTLRKGIGAIIILLASLYASYYRMKKIKH